MRKWEKEMVLWSYTISIVLIAASNPNAFGGSGNAVYFLILGSNIGTCSTALMSTFGANSNGKRAALIHLMFNLFGSLIFFIVLMIRMFLDMQEKIIKVTMLFLNSKNVLLLYQLWMMMVTS